MCNNTEEKQKMTFRNYYNHLDDESKKQLRKKFLDRCGYSYPTFYYKFKNNTFIKLERELLDEICNIEFLWVR